jgi:ABC-type branched-subunit amino acid transport system substrate-binding protein
VGGDALAPLADSSAYLGLRFAVPFDPRRPTTPRGAAFVRDFRARQGALPGVRAALGYEAARLIGEAALAVDLGADDRRRRVRDWLGALGQGRPAAEGVAGPIAFDAGHAVVGRGVLIATVGEPERPLLAAGARVAEGSR